MSNELKRMNKHDENPKEFRIFNKEYEIDREERKISDDTNFREDSFTTSALIIMRFARYSKGYETIKHDSPQILPKSYQRHAIVQREITNRPDTPSLENDIFIDPMRGQSTLRNVLSTVPIFDGYNVPITEFLNECRGVQNFFSGRSKCCNFISRQIAQPSTKDVPSLTIY